MSTHCTPTKSKSAMLRAMVGTTKEQSRSNIIKPFTVMQWNTLAMALSQPEVCLFECEQEALVWEKRKELIIQEILARNPDILCCQEIDEFKFFQSALTESGYEGYFIAKPRSPCLKVAGNIGPDGSIIFFKKNRFSFVDQGSGALTFKDGTQSNSEYLWILLQDKLCHQRLSVFSTHLKSGRDPKFAEIRTAQTNHLIEVYQTVREKSDAVIIAGDFNGESHEDYYSLLTDKAHLQSAYRTVMNGKEPSYTTWKIRKGQGEIKRCIDYIWYSSGVEPIEVLGLPRDEDILGLRFPSVTFPSDHLNLLSSFSYCDKNE